MECSNCGSAILKHEGFVACPRCGCSHFSSPTSAALVPFAVFGAHPRFEIDLAALSDRYYKLSALFHPDRFANSTPAIKKKAQELTALVNSAYATLRNPEERVEALLRIANALSPEEGDRRGKACTPIADEEIPIDLAEDFFELQERAMEADSTESAMQEIDRFDQRILGLQKTSKREIEESARRIPWENPENTDQERIRELLSVRRRLAYLRSMRENIERLRGKLL